ncbi:KCC4 kinase, partial [Polypterus senegalus]
MCFCFQIKLKEIFETPTEISLVLELVTGGELFDRIVEKGYYSERDAADAVKQILEAVAYLHENGVVHRDLKPENLLYATPAPDAPLKIGMHWHYRRECRIQTPEILRGCAYGPEVDMWSVGVITYILLCGFEPFYDERGDQYMFKRILNCDYDFVSPWWDDVSLNAKDLVKKLIVQDPKKRLTTLQALQHPWVTGKAVNFAHMDNAQKKLQEFNARRKLKAAVKAVVASTRLGSASSHGSHESSKNSHSASPIQEAEPNTEQTQDQAQIENKAHQKEQKKMEGIAYLNLVVVFRLYLLAKLEVMTLLRHKQEIMYENNHIRIFPNFSPATATKRAAFYNIKQWLRQANIKYSLLYPAKLKVELQGQFYVFASKEEAEKELRKLIPGLL